jgi:HPr kinase/phosphorylase
LTDGPGGRTFPFIMGMVHATCVRIMEVGVLLRGPSGGGKSDAALRLIEAGAMLVADDQVMLGRDGPRLTATAPEPLKGLLEVRHLGIVPMEAVPATDIGLVIELKPRDQLERLPEARTTRLLEVDVPFLELDPFESSFVAKVKAALAVLATGRLCRTPGEP